MPAIGILWYGKYHFESNETGCIGNFENVVASSIAVFTVNMWPFPSLKLKPSLNITYSNGTREVSLCHLLQVLQDMVTSCNVLDRLQIFALLDHSLLLIKQFCNLTLSACVPPPF